jgi:hypothetical protein
MTKEPTIRRSLEAIDEDSISPSGQGCAQRGHAGDQPKNKRELSDLRLSRAQNLPGQLELGDPSFGCPGVVKARELGYARMD